MHNFYLALVIILMMCGIICQIVIGILYQHLIHETESMSSTNHKVLKSCKCKFTTCFQMNRGVSNVSIFVDKFLNKLRFGKFTVNGLVHFSGQIMLQSALISGIGIYTDIQNAVNIVDLLPFYIVSFLGLYLYFAVSSIVNIQEKKMYSKQIW